MSAVLNSLYADCDKTLRGNSADGIEALRDTTLFITGGTGFLGSWVNTFIAFLNDNHGFGTKVVSVSRRGAGAATQQAVLGARSDIRHIACDVRQLVDIPPEAAWVIHAAATPDARHHASSPIETATVIADGTARVLSVAERLVKLRTLLHVSSGLVGDTTDPARARATSIYADAKQYSEALCAAYRSQARLPIVVTRPFTFVGPFQAIDAPWAMNNFIHSAINGLPLKLSGLGASSRSYLYGSDAALLVLLQLVKGRSGETYDLGGSDILTTRELADLVVERARRPLEVKINTAGRDDGVAHLVPNLTPSIRNFGFRPSFRPADAVSRTLQWFERSDTRRTVAG